jgi:hypothetical protein
MNNPQPGGLQIRRVVAIADECGIERVLHHIYEGDRDAMLRRLDRAAVDLAVAT